MTKKTTFLVFLMTAIMLLPFLGLCDFNSKGEPREAVVAVSILNSGNWILPINNGADIPYKPPFFHWCIAALSLPIGHVTEYTSRLPSALSLIVMAVTCFLFYAKRKNQFVALLATFLLITGFEVHRSAMACRVDMMLTAFIVGAMLLLYKWWENGARGIPLWAILCMTGATLTKGPVGIVLPCLTMGLFMLLRGCRFMPTFFKLFGFGLLSLILPIGWYVAAYMQGGDEFFQLVWEENVGRMTGTMTYGAHTHPWWYNFIMILSNWLPWSLLFLFTLFVLPWRRLRSVNLRNPWQRFINACHEADAVQMFTWVAFVTVFVFYCLPSSKRSVYLLPCMPFSAVLVAELTVWLYGYNRKPLKAMAWTITVIVAVLFIASLTLKLGLVPETIFHGRHAENNIAMMRALSDLNLLQFSFEVFLFAWIVWSVCRYFIDEYRGYGRAYLYIASVIYYVLFLLDAVYLPVVQQTKSSRPIAEMIMRKFPGELTYQYIPNPINNKMHFFGTDFYLNDRLLDITAHNPERGVLMVAKGEALNFMNAHKEYDYELVCATDKPATEVKDIILFYRFHKKK